MMRAHAATLALSSLLMLELVAACGGGKKTSSAPAAGSAQDCGWRETSTRCTTDADCTSGLVCHEGSGPIMKRESSDGVADMGPWDRERVMFCEPASCPVATDRAEPQPDMEPPTPAATPD
jgi:hypothetical protein